MSRIATRQLARNVCGTPTEILLQVFDDRTLLLVTQGKLGRMLQVNPPTRSGSQGRIDNFDDLDDEALPDVHSTLSELNLPPPDAAFSISNIFGTPRSDAANQVEHLYAAQIAAILFNHRDKSQSMDAEESAGLQTAGKPAIIGLGLKPAFTENGSLVDARDKFAQVMSMVQAVMAMEATV